MVPLDARLPEGPWSVELKLGSGSVEHAAGATVTFPTAPGGTGAVTASAAGAGDGPTPVVAGFAALALAAGYLLFLRIRRRRGRR